MDFVSYFILSHPWLSSLVFWFLGHTVDMAPYFAVDYLAFFVFYPAFFFFLSLLVFLFLNHGKVKNSVIGTAISTAAASHIFYFILMFTAVLHLYTLFMYIHFADFYLDPHPLTSALIVEHTLSCVETIDITLRVDPLSLLFLVLLTLLIPICLIIFGISNLIFSSEKNYLLGQLPTDANQKNTTILTTVLLFFSLEYILFFLFTVTSYFSFYIFFELSLIPTYLLIALLGARINKVKAAFYLLFYTLLGSFFFIIPLFYFIYFFGLTDISRIAFLVQSEEVLHFHLIYLSLFFALAIKIPIVPFHIWLPEAHVEASTEGSVILAGLLLKIGSYGIIRLLLIPFPYYTIFFQPLIFTIAIVGVIYASFLLLVQSDLKKIIAYYSIVHMNFALLGLYSGDIAGIQGGIYIVFTHGITSSILFIFVGFLYLRFHTRALNFYRALIVSAPIRTFFFFIFILGNVPFPGTGGFIGELFVFLSLINCSWFYALIIFIPILISAFYSFYLFTRVSYGSVQKNALLSAYNEFTFFEEYRIFALFALWILCTGFIPSSLLDTSLYISDLILTGNNSSFFI